MQRLFGNVTLPNNKVVFNRKIKLMFKILEAKQVLFIKRSNVRP